MNKYWLLIGILFPVAASATGVSFGYEIGAGIFLFFAAIVIGLVLMYRVVSQTRKDCMNQSEKADKNDLNHSKVKDD